MSDELHWKSATQLAREIAAREVGSREVLDHLVARIERLDGDVNAVVQWDLDRAQAAADAADAAVAGGDALGPMHGVPHTVKDSFQTEGCITTSGAPELAEFVPSMDADPVAAVRAAGSIPFAKTNLPIWAGDIQSFNDVYGTTNNPHDLSRTPGGSSGGSAAALAMGFTPFEIGSDIGGSIRVPAHYSGVLGHKTSYGIVPAHGQIPGPPGSYTQADLAVAGPMARCADDLDLGMDVLVGPDRWHRGAVTIELPAARATEPGSLRVAAWIDDAYCPVDSDTKRLLSELTVAFEKAGARVDTDARPDFTLRQVDELFVRLLNGALAGSFKPDAIEAIARTVDDTPAGMARRGVSARHRSWLSDNERRLQIRAKWEQFFGDFDVMLLPVHPRPAIEHDHHPAMYERMVTIDGVERSYMDLFQWTGPAGAAYLPATVVPIGMSFDGLPIGVQIVGPFLGDRTTIRVAAMIEEMLGRDVTSPRPAVAVP